MARGSQAKQEIAQKILDTFEGSFAYDKELRVPVYENGELIQVKITLTAAKTNVEPAGGQVVETAEAKPVVSATVTEEEKQQVNDLVARLGL